VQKKEDGLRKGLFSVRLGEGWDKAVGDWRDVRERLV